MMAVKARKCSALRSRGGAGGGSRRAGTWCARWSSGAARAVARSRRPCGRCGAGCPAGTVISAGARSRSPCRRGACRACADCNPCRHRANPVSGKRRPRTGRSLPPRPPLSRHRPASHPFQRRRARPPHGQEGNAAAHQPAVDSHNAVSVRHGLLVPHAEQTASATSARRTPGQRLRRTRLHACPPSPDPPGTLPTRRHSVGRRRSVLPAYLKYEVAARYAARDVPRISVITEWTGSPSRSFPSSSTPCCRCGGVSET